MDASHFLKEGEQSRFTPLVMEHAKKVRNVEITDPAIAELPEPRISVYRTCKYIYQLPRIKGFIHRPKSKEESDANRRLKATIFRKRTLDQMLREGFFRTCSDIGLLFRGLMAAQGHPTSFLETFHEDYLFGKSFHGHVFSRVFDKGGSFIVNPGPNPIISKGESDIFPYIVFREGLDSWDIGIHSYDDMHRLKDEHINELIEKYKAIKKAQFRIK